MNVPRQPLPSRTAAMPLIPASALAPVRVPYGGDVAELASLMAKLGAVLAVRATAQARTRASSDTRSCMVYRGYTRTSLVCRSRP